MSTSLHDEPASPRLATTWEVEIDYLTLTRFTQLVVERGLEHVSSVSWATERMTLEGLFDHALSTLRDSRERAAVLDLGDDVGGECIAHLSLERGRAYLRCGARTVDALADAKTWLQARYPVACPEERQETQITFWTRDRGARRMSRSISVPSWEEIAENYPTAVAPHLAGLVALRCDEKTSGRLILWHGVPGTGKTHALRALAWEWREWCSFHFITDPDEFFGGNPKYMLDVLLDECDDDESRWRLLILEDTGELLALDAKRQTGQGLSRLLNVVDGLIGQGLRVLVIVTTNETLRTLHPAVSRPGRCAALVEFTEFPPDEADAWLERHGKDGDGRTRSLASMFGIDDELTRPERPRVGFVG